MSAVDSGAVLSRPSAKDVSDVAVLILARTSVEGGATRAEAAADLAPLFTHKLSPKDWARTAEREIGQLIAAGLVTETKSRLTLTIRGEAVAARFLGQKAFEARPWAELRDITFIAKGLGIEREGAPRLKTLLRIEGLRALVVQKAFGLPGKKNQPATKLRAQLAVIALERAFGNRIKAGFGKGSALSASAGRLLAGQLSKTPRAFQTDAKLIAELAAEHVGAADQNLDAMRLGILRNLGARALESNAPAAEALAADPARVPVPIRRADPTPKLAEPANDAAPLARPIEQSTRPDIAEFSRAVKAAATSRAEGWPGSRKAYISHVWDAIRANEPRWGISEIEFKCMLAEAHRQGAVVLANADLKDKKNIKELESSSVPYKNTVWHFVRVED